MLEPLDKKKLKILLKEISKQSPLIINLSHQKGGVGKSTLAYNLADAFSILGFKVKILDIDIQNSCSSLNLLREIPFSNIEQIYNEEQLIEIINNPYSYGSEIIIIDTGGFDLSLSRLAIIGADINITPIGDKVTEILAVVQKYSKILREIELDIKENVSSYLLLNKIHPLASSFEHIEEMIEDNSQLTMFQNVVRDRSIYDKSFINGRTVFEASELKGHSMAKEEILSLCYEIIEKYLKRVNSGKK